MNNIYRQGGWTLDALKKLQIGFDGKRITIPYMEFEKVANVMRYLPDPPMTDTSRKILPISSGHGKRLYPDPELFSKGSMVFLVEGEPDAITATSAGLNAIAVPGANSWQARVATAASAGTLPAAVSLRPMPTASAPGIAAGQRSSSTQDPSTARHRDEI